MPKGIVYIDIEDEITSVIDKVESSTEKVLALVLPKHATTFLSTVNMKLLKRASDAAKKSIVLITSDEGILPLAGSVRLHVAKSLQSKPVIPAAPKATAEPVHVVTSDDEPVVAGAGYAAVASALDQGVIELDNTEKAKKTKPSTSAIMPKNRKLKVPNFNSFRVRLFLLGFAIVAVLVGGYFALYVMPKAKIVLKTEVTPVEVNFQFTASTTAKTVDTDKLIVPATQTSRTENDTEKVPATGKKDNGTKAKGLISVYNCSKTDSTVNLPVGTVFANSGHSFTTDAVIDVPASNFKGNGDCKQDIRIDVNVTAVQAGDSSNLSAGRAYSSSFADTVGAIGGAMGGGTSNIVTVVSNEDVEAAKTKLTGRQKKPAVEDCLQQLADAKLVALPDTLKEVAPVFTTDVAVGAEAANVTVKAVSVYTMLGVTKDDVSKLIESNVNKQITDTRQKIQNNGFDKRNVAIVDGSKDTDQRLSLATTAVIGPDIDISGIAQEAAGKKKGEIQQNLSSRAGIKDVTITYSPFWVLQTPKKPSKISVVVEQVNVSK